MDGQGYSLFHGGDNIRTENSAIDEEEELQRHKSIEKGLNDFLGDDLLSLDENEGSSSHSNIYKHHDQHIDRDDQSFMEHNPFYGRIQSNNQNYTPISHQNHRMHHNIDNSDSEEITRLNVALESKAREVDHVSKLLMAERNRNDELDKRLKLSEAEKDRAFMQKQQFHELLVEGKGRYGELEEKISELKTKIKNLETNNTQLVCELDNKKTLMSDLELKYRMIEKDAQCSRQVDSVLKQENDRHTAQAYMMQQEMNSLRNQLENKELEVKNLQARYNELQKLRTAMVEEHSDRTRQLQREIDENQRTSASTSYENLQLKKKIQSLEQDNSEMQRTLHQLTLRSEKSKNRSEQSDRLNNSTNDESFEYFKKNRSSLVGSTPINTNDEINRLKKELDRTTNLLQNSRQEIVSLQEQLQLKISENNQLKDDENNALVQMVEYKDECKRLNGKLCLLDGEFKHSDAFEHQKQRLEELQDHIDELQKINDELTNECQKLRLCNEQLTKEKDEISSKYNDVLQDKVNVQEFKRELDKQKFLLDDARKECDRLKDAYVEGTKEKSQIADELAQFKENDIHKELREQQEKVSSLQNDLRMAEWKYSELEKRGNERLDHEVAIALDKAKAASSITKNYSCPKCIDQKTILTKLEVENLELKNASANQLKEIADLKESINNLSNVVEMKKEYDIMLNELKFQAKEFAELVHNQNAKYTTSSMPPPNRIDQCVSTTPDLSYPSETSTRREIEIEMSKIMSAKVKQIENESLEQMQGIYRSVELLTGELQKAHSDIKTREKEVELLKLTLLAERKVSIDRIARLQSEFNSNSQKLLMKLQNQNEMLKKELEEKNQIEITERESVEVLKKQWNDTELSLLKDIENLKNIVAEFEVEKSQIIKRLNKKYDSAVKRGDNYRDYAEAKEKHIISESARIRDECQNKMSKMQSKYLEKLETILKVKEKEHTEKIIKIENEWRKKLTQIDPQILSNNIEEEGRVSK